MKRYGVAGSVAVLGVSSVALLCASSVALLCVSCGAPPPAATVHVPAAPAPSSTAACALTSHYQPQPAPSSAPVLPKPQLVRQPLRAGEPYTVWGASYLLRSAHHRAEVTGAPIAITGYIVKTSLPDAPQCAVHAAAVADKPSCVTPVPTFWLGDRPDAPLGECIAVAGFASSYGQIYDAIRSFDAKPPSAKYRDAAWGVDLPNPLPAAGAKVTVTGSYGLRFAKAPVAVDTLMGIVTFQQMQELEPASALASLPGVKRKAAR